MARRIGSTAIMKFFMAVCIFVLVGCGKGVFNNPQIGTATLPQKGTMPPPTATLTKPATITPTTTISSPSVVRFAVIGDYGTAGDDLSAVAELIESWEVDFIITTGDNNYPFGAAATIDTNIGQYFHEYIYPYQGVYGNGANANRFFPSLGNHDWLQPGAAPYLEYFSLPGNERYYQFNWEFVEFFALDSDWAEPDGIGADSVQAQWLEENLSSSEATWKIVYFHLPPYSSGYHGSSEHMRWPYRDWGADVVLNGHDHHYERLLVDEMLYFVNGLGGGARYATGTPLSGSQVRYQARHGAMLVEATLESLSFWFINVDGTVIDSYTLER